MKSSLRLADSPYCSAGVEQRLSPNGLRCVPRPAASDRLKPNLPSRNTVMKPTQAISRMALMICTQVVPFMPPTSTYSDHHDADDGDDQRLPALLCTSSSSADQAACAGHLGEHVEERRSTRVALAAAARTGRCLHPEGQHVAHGEPAGVAQPFGDEQQGDQPGDQPADGVQEAVVAVDGDGAGDAEEGRRGEEVPGRCAMPFCGR